MSYLIQLRDAGFGYKSGMLKKQILYQINLTVNPGSFTVMEGSNGSGKSTLLKGILGLATLQSGVVEKRVSRRELSYVPQEFHFDMTLPISVKDFICYSSGNRISPKELDSFLQLVGLEHKKHEKIGSLSGGQRRRILVLRALIQSPKVLLLDEPMANVDTDSQKHIESILTDINLRQQVAIIVSSHGYRWSVDYEKILITGGRTQIFPKH